MNKTSFNTNGKYTWYYEAKSGGWWQYEQRALVEIEKAFKDGKKTMRLQISGFYYVVNFEEMIQYREDFPSRRRKIKRDIIAEDVKGVAGIVIQDDITDESVNRDKIMSSTGTAGAGHCPTTTEANEVL